MSGNAVSYIWKDQNGIVISTSPDVEITASETSEYFLEYPDVNGCESRVRFTIYVYEYPIVNVSPDTTICRGSEIEISASGGNNYLWNTNNMESNISISPEETTTYVVRVYNDTVMCSIFDSITVSVIPYFDLSIRHDKDSICLGDSVTISGDGGDTFWWSTGHHTQEFSFTPDSTIIITLQSSNNQTSCSRSIYDTIVVMPLPNVCITADRDSVCVGDTINVSITGNALNYQWENGDSSLSRQIIMTQNLTVQTEATSSFGCRSNTNKPLVAISLPEDFNISGNTRICFNDSSYLEPNIDFDGSTYHWTIGSTYSNNNHITYIPLIDTNTVYFDTVFLSVENFFGCKRQNHLALEIQPIPKDSIISNNAYCINDTVHLSLSSSGLLPFEWGDPIDSQQQQNAEVWDIITQNTTYSVTVQNNYCSETYTKEVQAMPLPTVAIHSNMGDSAVYCDNASYILYAYGASTYEWSNGTTNSSLIFQANSDTIFSVIGMTGFNCKSQDTIAIHVVNVPEITISMPDDTICALDTIVLSVPSGFDEVHWNTGNISNELHVNGIEHTTQYSVIGLKNYGTTVCLSRDTVTVEVFPTPLLQVSIDSLKMCSQDTMILSVSGGENYVWNGNFSLNNTTGNSIQVTSNDPCSSYRDTLSVTGVIESTGCRAQKKIPIYINATPELSLSTSYPGHLCDNGSNYIGIVVNSDIPNTIFAWNSSPHDVTCIPNGNASFVSPDTTTVYSIVGLYTANGITCESIISDTINVFPIPDVTISMFPEHVCAHGQATLEATGGSHYLWVKNGSILATGTELEIIPENSDTYIIISEDENGCIGRDTLEIQTVEHVPEELALTPMTLCRGVPQELILSGANHCSWYPTTGVETISDSLVILTVTENSNFEVILTNAGGCKDTISVPVQVNPVPTISTISDTTICEGESVECTVTGGVSYTWSNGSTSSINTVSPDTTSSYRVIGTNTFGCSSSDSVTISVIPRFDLVLTSSLDSFCLENNTVILSVSGAGDSYLWSDGSTGTSITVHPTSTSSYSVTAYNNSTNCFAREQKEIVLYPIPEIVLQASDNRICQKEIVEIQAISNLENSYLWNNNSTNNTISAILDSTTTFYLTATNEFGCLRRDSISIIVDPLPEVNILLSDTTLCLGTAISVSILGNATLYESNFETTSDSYIPTTPGVHNLIATGYSDHLCTRTDTAIVNVFPLPEASIHISNDTICYGDTISLQVSGGSAYEWIINNTLIGTNAVISTTPSESTTYEATITNQYGCSSTLSTSIYVYPPMLIRILGDSVLCEGETYLLSATGGWNYLWNTGDSTSIITISPTQNSQYSVTSIDQHGCEFSSTRNITIKPTFAANIFHSKDTICLGETVRLWCQGAIDQYLWNTGSSQYQINDTPSISSVYTVQVHNEVTGCSKQLSDTIIVIPYPEFELSSANILCEGDTMDVEMHGNETFNYSWEMIPPGDILNESATHISFIPSHTTSLIYFASNALCDYSDSVTIEVNENPHIEINSIVNERCNNCNGNVNFEIIASSQPVQLFINGNPSIDTDNIQNLCEGNYDLSAIDALGCRSAIEHVSIQNIPDPEIAIADVQCVINGGDGSILIEIIHATGNYTIEWYYNSFETPLHNLEGLTSATGLYPGKYYVVLTDEACSTVAEITLPQLDTDNGNLFLPNAISASNSDQLNDYFSLSYLGDIKFEEITIYDRWGAVVFKSNDIHFKWDGSSNGVISPNSIYNYVLFYTNYKGTRKMLRGSVVVL